MEELQRENVELQIAVDDLLLQLTQAKEEKTQIQKCYDKAIQEVADSEAKREVAEKELRLAHDQIGSLWKELESLRRVLDNQAPSTNPTPAQPTTTASTHQPISMSNTSMINDSSICHLCQEKISSKLDQHCTISDESRDSFREQSPKKKTSPQLSPKQSKPRKTSWLFGKKQSRVQELESRSNPNSTPSSPSRKRITSSPTPSLGSRGHRSRVTDSPAKTTDRGAGQGEEFLVVNVTRSCHGITDMSPFKIVTKTNLPSFSSRCMEVHRSQGDFQWLYSALQEACPERIVPPLRPPISLDATISEFQRFLSRVAAHKFLSTNHLFIVFLTGTAEELRALKARYRPHRNGEKIRYKPAMGRDTSSGPLVDTKDYLTMLEQNMVGLTSHLEQSARRGHGTPMERAAHWFRAIGDSEPHHTYLKRAAADLARTCEGMEGQFGDSDEMLFIQNLQSLTDYVRVAQDLLVRVEEAVDQYLYWDEEVTIIEAVNSSPKLERHSLVPPSEETPGELQDPVNDDSGMSDGTNSSAGVGGGEGHTHSDSHMTLTDAGSHDELVDSTESTTSERWAHASKKCADAKDHLEMMCNDLVEELSLFDLQKEKEVKQILLDYASSQLERHEKFQGKWFAMRFILDSTIETDKRAIQFSPSVAPVSPTATTPPQSLSQSSMAAPPLHPHTSYNHMASTTTVS